MCYGATVTTNVPVIENICTAGHGRVDSGSLVYIGRSVVFTQTVSRVPAGSTHHKVRFHDTCQGWYTTGMCVHECMCVCVVCVCVGQRSSLGLNPCLQRNMCCPPCLIYHLPDSEDRPQQRLWGGLDLRAAPHSGSFTSRTRKGNFLDLKCISNLIILNLNQLNQLLVDNFFFFNRVSVV